MRALLDITPTDEQLKIVSRNRPGIEIIRGAAGSGKTTTALLRLSSLAGMAAARKARENLPGPAQILVLTFNRTLSGYIRMLASMKAGEYANVSLTISTFAKWAMKSLGAKAILADTQKKTIINKLGAQLPFQGDFLLDEIDYVLGRYLPENRADYLSARRDGRGITPRVPKNVREIILNEVIEPYTSWKENKGKLDWFDLEVNMAKQKIHNYDVVITDETQDFSANQLRAIMNQLDEVYAVTFVVDTAQRIYARGFTWQECGITIGPRSVHRLEVNYRNTAQIARFASPLLRGLDIDEDATIPDPAKCSRQGPLPKVIKGLYNQQLTYAIDYIQNEIDLRSESVAFLNRRGGDWFKDIRTSLARANLKFVEITRESEWPEGDENIALSTLHSSKGLEFDHVIIIGANAELFKHGAEEDDDLLVMQRRLLAMGISRAKKSVLLGYKPSEKSHLIDYLDPATFEEVGL